MLQADSGAKDQDYENDIEKPEHLCEFSVYLYMYTASQKKYTTRFFVITSANVDRFSKLFHWCSPESLQFGEVMRKTRCTFFDSQCSYAASKWSSCLYWFLHLLLLYSWFRSCFQAEGWVICWAWEWLAANCINCFISDIVFGLNIYKHLCAYKYLYFVLYIFIQWCLGVCGTRWKCRISVF